MDAFLALLPQVGVAVLTALITTVVVEYAAKPRLEARKARLIRDRQQIDEVIFGFQRAGMALGSVVPADSQPEGSIFRDVHQRQVVELGPILDHLMNSIARLPVSYAHKHREHIGLTSKFLGWAKSYAELAARGVYITDADVRQIGEDMPNFDTYFVVNVDFHDSQEPLIKRLFWKRFTAKEYRAAAVETMKKYGGTKPRTPEESTGSEDTTRP